MSADRLMATYLNDHLAGSSFGLELARRAARNNRGTDYGEVLGELTEQIAEDRQALQSIMRRLGVRSDVAKLVLAWAGEKLGRLKRNGRLLQYSPLSRLEELEMLDIGVEGKHLLWQALRVRVPEDPNLDEIELATLIERARSQRHTIEQQRRRAAADALR